MDQTALFNFLIDQYRRESSFYFMFLGMNGTGKSHATKKVLQTLAPSEPRQLVIASDRTDDTWDDLPEFPTEAILQESTGLYMYQIKELNKGSMARERELFMYEMALQLNGMKRPHKIFIDSDQRLLFDAIIHPRYGLKNATLVADDMKQYLPGYHEDHLVMQLLGKRRFRDLNFIACFHSPKEIPGYMMGKNPLLVLWATIGSNFDRAQHKIDEKVFELLQERKEYIDRMYLEGKAEGNPRKRGYCEPILIQTQTA